MQLDQLAQQELAVPWGLPGHRVLKGLLAPRALRVPLVPQVFKVLQVRLALPLPFQGRQAQRALVARKVSLAPLPQ